MADYRFLTTWCIDAPIDRVWAALRESEEWPRWWRGVERVVTLEPGDADGLGALHRYTWRSRLPYTLEFEMRTTRVEPPHLLQGPRAGSSTGRARGASSRVRAPR